METKTWLTETVSNLDMGEGFKLKSERVKHIFGIHKVSMWVPKPLNKIPAVHRYLSYFGPSTRGLEH